MENKLQKTLLPMANIETKDAIKVYFEELEEASALAHFNNQSTTFQLTAEATIGKHNGSLSCNAKHNRPRPLVQYCGLFLSVISLYLVVLHTLAYKNFLRLICVTNSADPEMNNVWRELGLGFYLLNLFFGRKSLKHFYF